LYRAPLSVRGLEEVDHGSDEALEDVEHDDDYASSLVCRR
jgi:hypothetical protein